MAKTKIETTLTGAVDWYDSPRQIALRALGIAVGTLLVIFIGAMLVVPRAYGGQALTVMSGSMQPALNPGDVIVVRGVEPEDVCDQVKINQIVTFFPESGKSDLVTHRVISKTAGAYPDGTRCRLVTQGDNNNSADPEPVSPEQVRGLFMYGIPAVGWARDWVLGNRIAAVAALGLVIAVYYLWPGSRDPVTKVLQLGDAVGPAMPIALDDIGGASGGFAYQSVAAPAAPAVDIELRVRELMLREREIRLREAEAAREFGYQAPKSLDFVSI